MFTGIIQALQPITRVDHRPGLTSFAVALTKQLVEKLQIGASIAIDGVCLTVVTIDGVEVQFDAMEETLQKTTIGKIVVGQKVNVERSVAFGSEIGGHIVSGHVTGQAEIVRVETPKNNWIVTFKIPVEQMKYIFPKGFIALDGASLTIVQVDKSAGTFTVHLIPETLRMTAFGVKEVGSWVNFEIDSRTQTIVDTIEALYKEGTFSAR